MAFIWSGSLGSSPDRCHVVSVRLSEDDLILIPFYPILHLHLIKVPIPPIRGSRDILYSQFSSFAELITSNNDLLL